MIQLTADLSDPLLELVRANAAPVDAVEVGPWFGVQRKLPAERSLPAGGHSPPSGKRG